MNPNRSRHVVVVGGRVAGSATAMLLARLGRDADAHDHETARPERPRGREDDEESQYHRWLPDVDAPHGLVPPIRATSDGPVGPGTAYFDATRMGTFRGEVTDYEPPTRIGFRETLRWFGSDLMEARPAYTLEADRDKTIVHHVAEGELFGMMRLMKPVAALLARSSEPGPSSRCGGRWSRPRSLTGHPRARRGRSIATLNRVE